MLVSFCIVPGATSSEGPGDCVWAQRIGGLSTPWGSSSTQTSFQSPAVDANGNLYVLGLFNAESITIGTTNLTKPCFGLLAKLERSGGLCWVAQLPGVPTGLKVDAVGNCLMVGRTGSSITVGGTNLPGTTDDGRVGVGFLAKFDNTGTLVWSRALGANIGPEDLAVDGEGNNYVSASVDASSVSFCGTNLTVAGNAGFCLGKLSPVGDLLWVQVIGSTLYQYGYGYPVWLGADASGNSYASGTICDGGVFGQTVNQRVERLSSQVRFAGKSVLGPSPGRGIGYHERDDGLRRQHPPGRQLHFRSPDHRRYYDPQQRSD